MAQRGEQKGERLVFVGIRLRARDVELARNLARRSGDVGYQALVRRWVAERAAKEQAGENNG